MNDYYDCAMVWSHIAQFSISDLLIFNIYVIYFQKYIQNSVLFVILYFYSMYLMSVCTVKCQPLCKMHLKIQYLVDEVL